MEYSPKLKKVMQQIKQIINDNDIAALVFLHTPGHGEYLVKVDPSYSVAKIENEKLRVRARLQEDFKGDKTTWLNKTADTSNMLSVLAETCGPVIYGIMQLSESLDKEVNAQHFGGGHSSHTQQNN